MQSYEIYHGARKRISKGWSQGRERSEDGLSMCLTKALRDTVNSAIIPSHILVEVDAELRHCSILYDIRTLPSENVAGIEVNLVYWNDELAVSKRQVVYLLWKLELRHRYVRIKSRYGRKPKDVSSKAIHRELFPLEQQSDHETL